MKVAPYQVPPTDKQHQLAAIDNFAGGVQLSKPETGLATDEFRQLVNWYIDDQGYLTLRPGFRPAQGEDVKMDNPGTSMFCTDVSPGNIIAANQNGSDVDVSFWDGSEWIVIHKFTTSSDIIQYLEYAVNEKKDVFFFDGADTPRRWSYDYTTRTVTGGTKGSTTLYNVADTSGLSKGMKVTIAIDQSPEYNVADQIVDVIVEDTSFTTDLDSSLFDDDPGAGSEDITGGTKSPGVGQDTHYLVASTVGMEVGLSITCANDAEPLYNVAQTITAFVENVSVDTDLDSSTFLTDPDGLGDFSWTGTGTVKFYGSFPLGLEAPTAVPTGAVDASAGVGIIAPTELYYRYTWFYDNGTQYGESNASPVSAMVDVVTATESAPARVTVTMPAFPTNVTKARVYRSKPEQAKGPFYYLGEIRTGTDFIDVTPVGEEGIMLPVDDGTVPNLKEAVVTAGRIVGIDGDIPEKIVWSEPGYPDLFPALNFIYLQEKAVGLVVFNRNTYILSESAVYMVPGSDFARQSPVKISEKGCISARTIQNVTTGICWLSNDNAYWANFNVAAEDGDYAIPIGTPLQDEIISMNPNSWKTATGGFFNEKYYLTLPSWGSSGAYAVWCWNMRPAMRMLKAGRWGGWTSMGWFANDIQGFEDVLYTLDPVKQADGYYYMYTHDASGASGTLKDYPRYAAGDYTASAIPVDCIIESGLSLLPIDVYETVLYRTTIIAETTGGTFTITAKLNKNPDATAEYTRILVVSLGDGYAQGAATDWFTWVQVGDDPNGLWPMVAVTNGDSTAATPMVYNVVDRTYSDGYPGLAVDDIVYVLPVTADGSEVPNIYEALQTVTALGTKTENVIVSGSAKSAGVGLPTFYGAADTSKFVAGQIIGCAGDGEAGYNVTHQTILVVDPGVSISTDLDSSAFGADPAASGTPILSYPTITTDAAAAGEGVCPSRARLIDPTPVWPALRQVHGKGTKRWPKGTKGNLVQLNFQGKDMGQTKINRIITYYKIITRAI